MLKCITKYLDAKAERERRQTEAVTAMVKAQTEFMMTVSKFYLDKEKLKLQKEAITPEFETGGIVSKNKNKTEIVVNGDFTGNKEILRNIQESLQEKKPRKFKMVQAMISPIISNKQIEFLVLESLGNEGYVILDDFYTAAVTVECNNPPQCSDYYGVSWEEVTDEH